MDINQRIQQVGVNIQEKAALIWNVANSLFGAYKPHEYGLVILPMVVVKRLSVEECSNRSESLKIFRSGSFLVPL